MYDQSIGSAPSSYEARAIAPTSVLSNGVVSQGPLLSCHSGRRAMAFHVHPAPCDQTDALLDEEVTDTLA